MAARRAPHRWRAARLGAAAALGVAAIAIVIAFVVDRSRRGGREEASVRDVPARSVSTPVAAGPRPEIGAAPSAPRPAPASSDTAAAEPSTAPADAASASDGAALGRLIVPVEGVAATALRDTFDDGRPGHRHEAIDIGAPRGTKVLAVDDGRLVKLFTSVPGGLTIYQFDRDARFAYYYAHLDRYADGVREGMPLHRGDVIGYVGTTGNAPADSPHLHFAVFRLGPERQWWKGEAINPFGALH